MLIYENEGFLEVESEDIKQLCRSTVPVTFGDTESKAFEVRAALCTYMDNAEQRSRVVFYSRALKVSLVFAAKGLESQTSWQHAQEVLTRLGFMLEDVDLRLRPAMLEVVLRDVPGLRSSAEARKERAKKSRLLAELQEACDKDPDSAQGKKAALRLSAEMRLGADAEELRLFLERSLASAGADVLAGKVKDLTSRLETAEALAESERSQRKFSDSITAAAEKRIQELEELLVDVETRSSDTLKQKRKIVQLQGRIKPLEQALASAEAALEKEVEKQGQFAAEASLTHERIALLEHQLNKAETFHANIQAQLEETQAEGSQVNESLKEAERRIKALDAALKSAEDKSAQGDEAVKKTEVVQAELVVAQQELTASLHQNIALEEQLAAALDQCEGLTERLRETEQRARDKVLAEEQSAALTEQNAQLASEFKNLRDEYAQQHITREHLEEQLATALDQCEGLTERLQETEQRARDKVLAEEQLAALTEQNAHLARELNDLRDDNAQQHITREHLEEQLATALDQCKGLTERLRETEQWARDKVLAEEQSAALTEQNAHLASELNDLRDEYAQQHITREHLEKRAAKDGRRISDLEDSLAKMTAKSSGLFEYVKKSSALSREIETLRSDLQEQKKRLQEEQNSRKESESAIEEAHKVIVSLESMIRKTESPLTEQHSHEASEDSDNQKMHELELKLETVENQLEQERRERKRLVKAVAAAEKKVVEQEKRLVRAQTEQVEKKLRGDIAVEKSAQAQEKAAKPLPHELRPVPRKDALFRPDWDLAGLPCQSSRQVFKAWETVFNVQTSLEGYPSQYCMAFLVVLRLEKQKKLYLLYRLKKSKHTLVCVPVKTPKDEPSLAKAIKEGLNFLKISGFGMEIISKGDIESTLRPYFLED